MVCLSIAGGIKVIYQNYGLMRINKMQAFIKENSEIAQMMCGINQHARI